MENTWSNLVERAKNNDQNAFYELYQNSYDAVYLAVKSMIKDDDTVLDIVQDAFVKGFDSLSSLDDPERFLPWLKRIATNKARDWYKKKHDISFSQLSDEEDYIPDFEDDRLEHLPEEVIDRNETRRLIDEILGTLSDEQRIAIGMFYYQDMSIAEIASEIGVSENTVKSRLNYGRKKIRTGVEELEKKGTKLYGLAPVPFLIWLFKCQTAQASTGTAPAAIFENIVAQSASLSTATSTGAASAGAAASAGGGLFSSTGAKIVAGILSAVLIISIGTGVYLAANREGEVDIPAAVEEITPEITEEATTEVTETTTQPTTVTTTETTTQPTTVTTTQATTETTTQATTQTTTQKAAETTTQKATETTTKVPETEKPAPSFSDFPGSFMMEHKNEEASSVTISADGSFRLIRHGEGPLGDFYEIGKFGNLQKMSNGSYEATVLSMERQGDGIWGHQLVYRETYFEIGYTVHFYPPGTYPSVLDSDVWIAQDHITYFESEYERKRWLDENGKFKRWVAWMESSDAAFVAQTD